MSAMLLAITSVVVTGAAALAAPTSATDTSRADDRGPVYLDARQPTHRRVADLLRRMTLEEKVGQMTQTERGAVFDNPSLIAEDQVPVNVGDRDYEPLFPYGWG
jgi:beta-glucosidase